MKKSILFAALPLMMASCGVARIVTVAPEPVVVKAAPETVVVVQPQPQTQVVYTQPVSTTVTYPRTSNTRTTTIEVTPLTQDMSLYLDLQAVAAAFAQANSVEEFEMILNSSSYIISNLDLNRDGYIDYLRVLETLEGHTHVLLIQAVLAANIYQDVATLVVEMGYATPYVQVIGAPYIYGANYIIEPVYYKRPPLFDRFGRPTYAYWRSPYYWDHFPSHYGHHEMYHLGHYQAYVTTYMEHHHYCHNFHYVDHYHYTHYADVCRPVSRTDYAQQHPEQSFSRRTTATYIPAGSQTATRVTNARQLQQAVEQSGAARTTTSTKSSSTSTRSSSTSSSTSATSTRSTTATQSSRTTTAQPATTQPATSTRSSSTTSTSTRTTTAQPATRTGSTQQRQDVAPQTRSSQAQTQSQTTTRVRTSGTASTTRTPAASSTRSTTTSTRSTSTSTGTRSTGTRSTGTETNTRSTSTSTRSGSSTRR